MRKTDKVKVGMKVQITERPKSYGDDPAWVSDMNVYKGKKTTITKIDMGNSKHWVTLKIDGGGWSWEIRWLKKVK